MTARTSSPAYIDASAISISALCIMHCLALPVLAASLPVLGVLTEAEWIHRGLVAIALPITAFALFRAQRTVNPAAFTILAIPGLSLLLAGAFVEALHDYETTLTVMGAVLLATAHIWRWRQLNK